MGVEIVGSEYLAAPQSRRPWVSQIPVAAIIAPEDELWPPRGQNETLRKML